MTPTRGPKFPYGFLFVITLLAGVVPWSGCGSDGAGTIHIESPKARKQMMQTGAGPTPTTTPKRSYIAWQVKFATRDAGKKGGQMNN
jgi:hypothetical protein